MDFRRVLVTGGAGFIGCHVARALKRIRSTEQVTVLDNLRRRGSELNLGDLKRDGISFVHGDVRSWHDLDALPEFDLLIDCSAEPAVQAGLSGSPVSLLELNLQGTINCIEAARRRSAWFMLLSSSRVYPIEALNGLTFTEESTRFVLGGDQGVGGCSDKGIQESFTVAGPRSLYGTTKLAAELVLLEYVHSLSLHALINRCGLVAGPKQMGKVDQGVVGLWVAAHTYGHPLDYRGFGGTGKQVRDILHVTDLCELIVLQMQSGELWDGRVYNVGGGRERSASLLELTELCRMVTGNRVPIGSVPETSPLDIRIYISDAKKLEEAIGWAPRRSVETIIEDTYSWLRSGGIGLRELFLT